jgi:hypothetical protein
MPCFGLIFYILTFLRRDGEPDILLFLISIGPNLLTSLRISASRRKIFAWTAVVCGIWAVVVGSSLAGHGVLKEVPERVRGGGNLPQMLILLQFVGLASSVTSYALNYYRYTHPRAALLDVEGCYPTMRKLYSTSVTVLFTMWHFADLAVVAAYVFVRAWFGEAKATWILISGSVVSIALTLPVTKYVIQLRMIDLLLPCFTQDKRSDRDVKKMIRPLGGIAFGMIASSCSQAMFIIGWVFCKTFRSKFSDFYVDVLQLLILTGAILNASALILSGVFAIHPVESRKF